MSETPGRPGLDMLFSWKLIRFCIVGVGTALLQSALLYTGVALIGLETTLASSIAFVIVVIFNYLMHYNWTFAEPAPHTKTVSRYLFMIFCGFLINGLIMYVGVSGLGVNYILVQIVAMLMVILWNFSLALLWVFRA
jgi:putative flippase GtrA